MPYCEPPWAIAPAMSEVFAGSSMQSLMNGVAISTSAASARPLPSARGSRRCDTAQRKHARELLADLALLVRRERRDDAVDGLRRVEGVQRREHEVAGLGGDERRLDRLEVAHFADEDDVGILTQRAAEAVDAYDGVSKPISRCVTTAFTSAWMNSIGSSIVSRCSERVRLMRSTSAASVVLLPLPVTPVTRTRPRDSSASSMTEPGQPERRQRRHGRRDETHRHGHGAALAEDTGAAAADARRLPGDVDFEMGPQALLVGRRQEAAWQRLEVGRAQHLDLRPALERAVDAHERHVARAQVDIRGALLGGRAEERVKRHDAPGASAIRVPKRISEVQQDSG